MGMYGYWIRMWVFVGMYWVYNVHGEWGCITDINLTSFVRVGTGISKLPQSASINGTLAV